MNNLFLLTKVQFSETAYTRGTSGGFLSKKKSKSQEGARSDRPVATQMILTAVVGALMSLYYTFSIDSVLSGMAAFKSLPVLAFILTAVTGLTDVQSKIFDFRDYDVLCAMPLKPSAIIGSKLLAFTTYVLYSSFFLVVPGAILSGILGKEPVSFYLLVVLGFPGYLLPAITIAGLLGFLVRTLIRRSRHARQIELVLNYIFSFLLVALIIVVTQVYGRNAVKGLPVANILPFLPAVNWYITGALEGDVLKVLLSTGAGILIYAAFVLLFSRAALRLAGGTQAQAKTVYQGGKLQERRPLSSLIRREFKGIFGVPVYAMNVLISGILISGGCIFLMIRVKAYQPYLAQLAAEGAGPGTVALISTLIASILLSTISPTSSSVSLEGRTLWILKTAPLSARTIFHAKMIPQFFLSGIPALLVVVTYLVYYPTQGMYALLMALFFAAQISFLSRFGLMCDLKHPKLDWDSPVTVVKQSVAVLIATLVPMFLFIGMFIAAMFLMAVLNPAAVFLVLTAAFLALSILEAQWLKKYGAWRWQMLS